MHLSIIIPTYNGRRLLAQNLPVVLAAKSAEVIVVDDASTDDTANFLTTHFPQISLIRLTRNLGFAHAINTGVSQAKSKIIILLNNDVAPDKNCFLDLDKQFASNSSLFSVGFLETDPRTGLQRGKSRGFWRQGLVHHAAASDLNPGPTFWTFAAAAAYRRSMWDKLSGLDPLFRPAYWEDIDLCFRAQKQGWQVVFDPQRQVNHWTESTMSAVLGSRLSQISSKNQLLFVWKNITSLRLLISHLFWLPYHLIFTSLKSKGSFLVGFFEGLIQLPEALIKRLHQPSPLQTDETILSP